MKFLITKITLFYFWSFMNICKMSQHMTFLSESLFTGSTLKCTNPVNLKNGDGKFLHEPRSGKWRNWKSPMNHERYISIPVQVTIFPHEWLSRRGEKKILHERRSREWRIFFLPQLLSHEWGKIVTCTGIEMYLSWFIGNFSRPKFLKWLDSHSY